MKLHNSKSGFTLIELLVVIGILAVLAAIAIPSVAGLIDRANVSADATNANEMTNAIERFASEYELYRQDLASGTLNLSNLDSVQGRVLNVIKASTRGEIEQLEGESGFSGRKIDRDTKYPLNAETTQAIIENYTKTSSSTFEPKQSDKHFWYSPDCGVVVVADPNSSATQRNELIVSGMDAKGNTLSASTGWINLTLASYGADAPTPDENDAPTLDENETPMLPDLTCEHRNTEQTYTAPTCTQDGYRSAKVCKDCGVTLQNAQTFSATGHSYFYQNGICLNCGALDPNFKSCVGCGWVDGDYREDSGLPMLCIHDKCVNCCTTCCIRCKTPYAPHRFDYCGMCESCCSLSHSHGEIIPPPEDD